jgi:hypothetical protein
MDKPAPGETNPAGITNGEKVLYSAEVRHADGETRLIINDHVQRSVEVYTVPKKLVQKLPFYLSMLRSKIA